MSEARLWKISTCITINTHHVLKVVTQSLVNTQSQYAHPTIRQVVIKNFTKLTNTKTIFLFYFSFPSSQNHFSSFYLFLFFLKSHVMVILANTQVVTGSVGNTDKNTLLLYNKVIPPPKRCHIVNAHWLVN